MENPILAALDDPHALEALYHTRRARFRDWLADALLQEPESETLGVWEARLRYTPASGSAPVPFWGMLLLCLVAGFLIRFPDLFLVSSAARSLVIRFDPHILTTALVACFVFRVESPRIRGVVATGLLAAFGILALLPDHEGSASILMALLHMPVLLLSLLGLAFTGTRWQETDARLEFLRYLGEIGILSTLILIGGVLLTLVTFGLFGLIGIDIELWYLQNIVPVGSVCAPIVATYLHETVLGRQSRIAELIARVFSPLFLVTIAVYLVMTLLEGKNPGTDRDVLIFFNGLLLLIWGLAVFSLSGASKMRPSLSARVVPLLLVAITLVIDAITLSAILFRLMEHGLTPNRVAVTGANLVVFGHLLCILKAGFAGRDSDAIPLAVARYLPVYPLWSLFIVVGLPLLFRGA